MDLTLTLSLTQSVSLCLSLSLSLTLTLSVTLTLTLTLIGQARKHTARDVMKAPERTFPFPHPGPVTEPKLE